MERKIRQPEDVLFRKLQDETVILDAERGRYYGLDPVGTRMWEELLRHGSIEEACAVLREEFDVDADRLRVDMQKLVDDLVQRRLLELGSGSIDGPERLR